MNDPTVRGHVEQAAYSSAQQGFQVAKEGVTQVVSEVQNNFHRYVQEGPAGISVLCFIGGLVTAVVGFFGLFNLGGIFTQPFQYVLNIYLTVFGVVTFLLESDLESFQRVKILGRLAPLVERYQMEVEKRANFLTELRGRGFFYIFIGTLAATQCLVCPTFLVGLWNLLMGILCSLMSFGINPALPTGPGAPLNDHGYPQHGGMV